MRGLRPDSRRRILTPRAFHASIAERNVVYSGQVDGSPRYDSQTLGYYEFDAKNTSGDYSDVQPHMTIDLGTSPGARDLGSNRIRPTVVSPAAEVRIAEIAPSLFPLADNLYFTIVEEYRPWARLPRGVGASINGATYTNSITMYIDYDRGYTESNEIFEPKANITRSSSLAYAPKPAGWVDGYRTASPQTYRTVTLSSAFSFTFTTGGSISGRLWDVGDGTITVGSTAHENITVRFPVGFRYITLRVVDNTGSRYGFMRYPIWVHDDSYPPLSHFAIPRDFTGDWRELELDFFEQPVDETVIPKGVAICVWEDDPFWGQTIPDGYRDQMLGWNKEDVTLFQKYRSRTTMTVTGMGEWFNRARPIPQRIQDPNRTPESWFEMQDITLDRLTYYLYHYFSTGSLIGNLYKSTVTDILKSLDLTGQSLLGQMQYSVQGYYGRARFDSLNQLFLKRHYSYMNTTERAAVSSVFALTEADHPYDAPIKINRRYYNLVASLLGAGASFDGTTTSTIYNARAPGRTPAEGNSEQDAPGQNLPSTDAQNQLTRLTACHFKYLNNERDSVPYELLYNLDGIEPAWGEPISVSETDADSGLEIDNDLFMVKEITITRDNTEPRGKQIELTLEGVTTGALTDAQMVEVPVDESDPPDSEPPIDVFPIPVLPPSSIPPEIPGSFPAKIIMFSRTNPLVAMATSYTYDAGTNHFEFDWQDRSGNLAALGATRVIKAYANPFHYLRYNLLTPEGIITADNLDNSSPVYTLKQTSADLFDGNVGHDAFGSHMVNGWNIALCGKTGLAVSFDDWNTFTQVGIAYSGSPIYTPNTLNGGYGNVTAFICGRDPNHLYGGVMFGDSGSPGGGQTFGVYKSTDGGLTWTLVPAVTSAYTIDTFMHGSNRAQWSTCIPYTKPGGAANMDDGNLFIEFAVTGFDSAGHFIGGARIRSLDGMSNNVLRSTQPNTPFASRYHNSVSYYTHDANYNQVPTSIGGYLYSVPVSTSDDGTNYEIPPYGGMASNPWTEGWVNPQVIFCFDANGSVGQWYISVDEGVTWSTCNKPTSLGWSSTEAVIGEGCLFSVSGMPQ